MSRIKDFYNKYLSRINAYWLVTIVFFALTFAMGDSSLYKRYTYDEKIRSLEKEIKHYQKEIDWEIFWDRIRMTDGILFAEAIFRLGVQYLGFKEKQFYFPEGVNSMKLDTERLMEDILHSGIHGKGTRSRLHSGTLTLHAAEKRGLSGIFPGLFYMAFPPAKNLLWRFPYLKKHPYLLPFAWGQRLCGYLREGPVLGSVKEIVKTGRKRKEILREYGIFGEKRR